MTRFFAAILIAILALAQEGRAQRADRVLDSLERLSATAPDSLLPRIYYDMAWQNRLTNPVGGMQYALKSIDLALANNNKNYIVLGYNLLAFCEKYANMPETAMQHYITAKDYAEKFGIPNLCGQCYNNLARLYLEYNDLETGDFYLKKAVNIANELGDSLIQSYSYLNLGIMYKKQMKYDLAIGYLTESYQMRAGNEDVFSSENFVPLWHLADIYMERQEFEKSKNLMYISLNNPKIQEMPDYLSRIWYKLSQIYFNTNMLDSAEFAGLQSLIQARKCLSMLRLENTCKILDSIYLAKGEKQKAANICKEYMDICDTIFNSQLSDQLQKIQYSSEYVESKKIVDQSLSARNISVIWLNIAVVFLLVVACSIFLLILRNRKIRHLNSSLVSQRQSLERGLTYANAIQMAVQSDIYDPDTVFRDQFLLYIPRDIVSGDFFWRYSDMHHEMLVVADCTGHGVPGALLTMLGTSMLQDMATSGIRNSGEMLNELRLRIKAMLGANQLNRMQDGMDISLIIIDRATMTLDFAGAYNSLWYIRDGQFGELKANRCPIGEYVLEKSFESKYLQLCPGDMIYMLSDGYTSQFGGSDNSKISSRQLKAILLENNGKSMAEIREILLKKFNDWKGQNPQIDDVTIAGFRF
ncbi:MAG: SpoIIE family protein phosphatase [Bacteroidales bacterium]|nr:SpoIIE family protein phosphatase [Bacteroidales bacterium]